MALKSRVDLKVQQGLSLSAGMRASIAVLRMPTAALLDEIAREAAENPFLQVDLRRRAVFRPMRSRLKRPPLPRASAIFLRASLRSSGLIRHRLAPRPT